MEFHHTHTVLQRRAGICHRRDVVQGMHEAQLVLYLSQTCFSFQLRNGLQWDPFDGLLLVLGQPDPRSQDYICSAAVLLSVHGLAKTHSVNGELMYRDGLAARSLCIPLGATGRGGLQDSLAKASRAAQSGLRARQKDLQAIDARDLLMDPEMEGLKQADPTQPSGAPETQSSAHQRAAGSVQASALLRANGQPGKDALARVDLGAGELTHALQEQHGADSAPLPTAGTTPESLPSDRRGPSASSDSTAQIQHIDLFEQLGPRPLQSLAASSIAKEPSRPAALASQGSHPGETEANTGCSRPAVSSAAEVATIDTTAEPSMHPHNDEGRGSADSAGSGESGWTSQQRAKQAKHSMPPALPVVPEASGEESPSGAEKSRQGGPLRRSLLPAVHPRFRSSPLRTPAVIQSLSMLPDQATSAQSGQSRGPGSSDVVISSSWDRSAKQVHTSSHAVEVPCTVFAPMLCGITCPHGLFPFPACGRPTPHCKGMASTHESYYSVEHVFPQDTCLMSQLQQEKPPWIVQSLHCSDRQESILPHCAPRCRGPCSSAFNRPPCA